MSFSNVPASDCIEIRDGEQCYVRNVQFMPLIWFSNVLAQVCIEILGGSSLLGRLDVEKNDE